MYSAVLLIIPSESFAIFNSIAACPSEFAWTRKLFRPKRFMSGLLMCPSFWFINFFILNRLPRSPCAVMINHLGGSGDLKVLLFSWDSSVWSATNLLYPFQMTAVLLYCEVQHRKGYKWGSVVYQGEASSLEVGAH